MTLQTFLKTFNKLNIDISGLHTVYADSKMGLPYYQIYNEIDEYNRFIVEYAVKKHSDKIKYLNSAITGDKFIITLDTDSVMKVFEHSRSHSIYIDMYITGGGHYEY